MRNTDNSLARKLLSVERFFSEDVAAFCNALAGLEREIDPDAIPQRNDEFHRRTLKAFEQSQVACKAFQLEHADDPVIVKDAQAGFLKDTDPWFMQSWIGNRARTKPAGFVGDYEMLINFDPQC